jgi:glutathione S-transferase
MADELVLYTNPMSRGRVVRWMLEEVGQPYKVEVLDYASTMKGPNYLAINPMGKVPALRHGDAVITETAAICAYLADAFPQAHLAPPPGDRLRAPYYRWLFFTAGPFEAAASNKVFFRRRCLCRGANRLRNDVRHAGTAPRFRTLLAAHERTPGLCTSERAR